MTVRQTLTHQLRRDSLTTLSIFISDTGTFIPIVCLSFKRLGRMASHKIKNYLTLPSK